MRNRCFPAPTKTSLAAIETAFQSVMADGSVYIDWETLEEYGLSYTTVLDHILFDRE